MKGIQREEFERRWREKYGCDVTSDRFKSTLSIVAVDRVRTDIDDFRASGPFAELLDRFINEIHEFLERDLPGGQASPHASVQEFARIRGMSPDAPGLDPSYVSVADRATALQASLTDDSRRFRQASRRAPPGMPSIKRKAADHAFNRVCWHLGQFTKAKVGTAQWTDVAACLEYYGHPTRQYKDASKVCMSAARQWAKDAPNATFELDHTTASS